MLSIYVYIAKKEYGKPQHPKGFLRCKCNWLSVCRFSSSLIFSHIILYLSLSLCTLYQSLSIFSSLFSLPCPLLLKIFLSRNRHCGRLSFCKTRYTITYITYNIYNKSFILIFPFYGNNRSLTINQIEMRN